MHACDKTICCIYFLQHTGIDWIESYQMRLPIAWGLIHRSFVNSISSGLERCLADRNKSVVKWLHMYWKVNESVFAKYFHFVSSQLELVSAHGKRNREELMPKVIKECQVRTILENHLESAGLCLFRWWTHPDSLLHNESDASVISCPVISAHRNMAGL